MKNVLPVTDGIYQVETRYMDRENYACCYLLEDAGEVAIIETNTNYAVPRLLAALDQLGFAREQVKYVILTHIHLDHAGGSGQLMRHLPNARLVVHPRGRKHMINPEKLIKSVKAVYGEEKYKTLYGEILPVAEERVDVANDGDVLSIGHRELTAYDLAGHAKHHIVLWDKDTGSLFSGDNFGISYPQLTPGASRLVFPSTTPTQFEPDKALETYEKIAGLQPKRILLVHYGVLEDIAGSHAQLKDWIRFSTAAAGKRYAEGSRDSQLDRALIRDLWERLENQVRAIRGSRLTTLEKDFLTIDTELNGKGLAHYITKINSNAGS
ncbi:MAG: MBL fold metallo-hydrolase [bacterium]|nr:MBL fold metallo-hydrolase [bacterium]